MPASIFDGGIAIDVGELAEAEAVRFVVRVGETVDDDRVRLCVEDFTDPRVQLVIGDAAPVDRFLIGHRRQVSGHRRSVGRVHRFL